MADQQQQTDLTEAQIDKVFQQLDLGGGTPSPPPQPQSPPASQPLYFPLSADSLSSKKPDC